VNGWLSQGGLTAFPQSARIGQGFVAVQQPLRYFPIAIEEGAGQQDDEQR
jgi:hypothetical protein